MAKLTGTQLNALAWIAELRGKSGRFWRDLNVSPQTLSSLERRGLLLRKCYPLETSVLGCQWSTTEAGRAALKEEEGEE